MDQTTTIVDNFTSYENITTGMIEEDEPVSSRHELCRNVQFGFGGIILLILFLVGFVSNCLAIAVLSKFFRKYAGEFKILFFF